MMGAVVHGGRHVIQADTGGWISEVIGVLAWPGEALARTEVCGCRAYPVIEWINENISARSCSGVGPQLHRPTLSLWERTPDTSPPRPLRIVGFLSDAPWRQALHAVHSLRGLGARAIVSHARVSELKLGEADFYDLSVVTVGGSGATLLVRGSDGPVLTARRRVGTRFWEEYLYCRALADGLGQAMAGSSGALTQAASAAAGSHADAVSSISK